MEQREILAYAIIAVMLVVAATWLGIRHYHSPRRRGAKQFRRNEKERASIAAERRREAAEMRDP